MKFITEANARIYTYYLILVTFIARLFIAGYTGLGIGESYYFRGALNLNLSYFDQPPLFFWLGGLSTRILGLNALGLRLPSVILFAGTSWLMFLITRLLFNSRSGFYAILLLNLSAVFTMPIACWFQPDAPLMFFWLLSTYFIVKLLFTYRSEVAVNRHSGKIYLLWLLIGISMGLDILSKYHVLFLFAGTFIFIVSNKTQRHWLRHPGPYLAFLLSLLIAFPVFLWNYHHHWVSFVFQGSRAGTGGGFKLHFDWFFRSIAGQAVWLLPWIWLPLIIQLIRSYKLRRSIQAYGFIFWTAVLPLVFFTLVTLWSDLQYHFHWQAPGYMMLFIPLGVTVSQSLDNQSLKNHRLTKRWLSFSVYFTVITVAVANLHMVTGFWQSYGPKWVVSLGGGKWDPTIQGVDYNDLRDRYQREGWLNNKHIFTGSTRWWLTGKIDWALRGQKPIVVFDEDPRNLAFLIEPKTLIGDDAVIIGQDHQASIDINVKPFFDTVTQLRDIIIKRNGVDEMHLQVYYCKDFHISKTPHEEFPVYRQLVGRQPFGK
ncbi:ArnT family glycosyltransferase [Mucilaginibacter agri]|uniref:Phospholipid carrier-dependent glycosyltransferase n=1 Tax=Mucilaginibacter agri TaxID=2695265 RepID=A0A965ZCE2_9SPHI|nr:glycosyltransferase family 39 protein [Mucilaginibacter agri]NCD68434.1 phospholipid carrier-dependent glycosyltransferase [Mucilaginibacter agri]